jgi:hypothetical protein
MDSLERIVAVADNIRTNMLRSYDDDTMGSKLEFIKMIDVRHRATIREALTSTQTSYQRLNKETAGLISDYENIYESNDAIYTNQRKAEYQTQLYESLETWRLYILIFYYILFVAVIVFRPVSRNSYKQIFILILFASLPFWVDMLVEKEIWLLTKVRSFLNHNVFKNNNVV